METYPICIPLHPSGGKLRDNSELRFTLRSIHRHFQGKMELVIVGVKLPEWLINARHLRADGLKSSLQVAATAYPEGFFWWYDDLVMLRDAAPERLQVTTACGGWVKAVTGWAHALESIRTRLVKEGYPATDYSRPHGPYWFDLAMVEEGFADWPGMKSKFPWESWILSKRRWPSRRGVTRQYYGPFRSPPGSQHELLNYNDVGFSAELRAWLNERFPQASPFEDGADRQACSAVASDDVSGGSDEAGPESSTPRIEVSSPRKNALSFSLYGDASRYAVGAIENVRLAREFYPGWDVVIHAESGHYAIPRLRRDGAVVIEHPPEKGALGMRWRFDTLAWQDRYANVCIRDADSRVNPRERAAVDDWLASVKSLHCMRDHRQHRKPVMGGMFGMKTGVFPVRDAMEQWSWSGAYADDEAFLGAIVWPALSHDAMVHSRVAAQGKCRFPDHAPWDGYVGQRENPSMDPSDTRLVLLSPEHYGCRRERFKKSLSEHGGFLNRIDLEWWRATPHDQCFPPPSFREVRKVKHWWAATCDHLRIMEQSIVSKSNHLFLFEDDACFSPDFEETFWRSWCALPPEWKALRLGWHAFSGKVTIVPGVLDRCQARGGLMIANFWNRTGLIRAYDHFWHRRKMIIDMAFQDLRALEPRDWYQPPQPIVTKDPLARQQGRDR